MIVKDLIEQLKKQPQDALVVIATGGYDGHLIEATCVEPVEADGSRYLFVDKKIPNLETVPMVEIQS